MLAKRLTAAWALACMFGLPGLVNAQTYPAKPVRMIVAFAPGGPTDLLACIVAAGMTRTLGQQVVVENRGGAAGVIGTREVAKAPADGYVLLFAGDVALTLQPQLAKDAGYDGRTDFTPLRVVASQNNVLVASAAKGIADVPTLIAQARARPGSIAFGSAGTGSPSHLIGVLFQAQAGVELLHVPYKGAGPAMNDLIGGHIDVMFVGMPVALHNAARKELAVLAVTGDRRAAGLPAVPTFAELGIGALGSDTAVWWAVVGPARLPAEVRARLDAALQAALSEAETLRALTAQGVEVLNHDGATAAQWIERDHGKWGKLVGTGRIVAN